jgi:hypothetical protein
MLCSFPYLQVTWSTYNYYSLGCVAFRCTLPEPSVHGSQMMRTPLWGADKAHCQSDVITGKSCWWLAWGECVCVSQDYGNCRWIKLSASKEMNTSWKVLTIISGWGKRNWGCQTHHEFQTFIYSMPRGLWVEGILLINALPPTPIQVSHARNAFPHFFLR